jgi:hypothetical protein
LIEVGNWTFFWATTKGKCRPKHQAEQAKNQRDRDEEGANVLSEATRYHCISQLTKQPNALDQLQIQNKKNRNRDEEEVANDPL